MSTFGLTVTFIGMGTVYFSLVLLVVFINLMSMAAKLSQGAKNPKPDVGRRGRCGFGSSPPEGMTRRSLRSSPPLSRLILGSPEEAVIAAGDPVRNRNRQGIHKTAAPNLEAMQLQG